MLNRRDLLATAAAAGESCGTYTITADDTSRIAVANKFDTTVAKLDAAADSSIKAIVLRVDSPGGGVFASEQIRREVELTKAAGKPVVVSKTLTERKPEDTKAP